MGHTNPVRSPSDLQQEAQRLYAEARSHKRLSELHRRRSRRHKRHAQESMARFDQFKQDLEAMGIEVVLEPHMPQGGNSDRSSTHR